ncbi:beta-lactamase/transpeptidase-like protein [Dendrothele bispora CBS 962.96]|uniref:Beta-lactamase/transpeptidase-like protein n=1 Tax=Dendrothele bispora (strain CBS 962.96) TaxID=1314807 RepID=A0A4S8KVG4_DENBC|nr:beta-lactamase/transpeptidase-like protein [Dendrothele bispora CBS 962.96]
MFSPSKLLLLTSSLAVAYGQLLSRTTSNNPSSTPRTVQNVLTPEFDLFVEQTLDDWNSSGGVSIAVVQMNADGIWNVENKGYGTAKGDGSKVTEDTYFSIGSNSKLFDAIAVGLLVSNESLSPRISWNTKVASLLPEWGMEDPVANSDSTILDLLGHRTGLPRHDLMYEANATLPDLINRTRYLRPSVGFRERYQYENLMYGTLSYLPEFLIPSLSSYARYVKDNIFVPLGLNQTTFSTEIAEQSGNLAQSFARQNVNTSESIFGKGTTKILPNWNTAGEDGNMISGAGGIMMSARDATAWLRTLLLEGRNPANGETVIPSEIFDVINNGIAVVSGVPTWPEMSPVVYSAGQTGYSYRGHEHAGGVPGFISQISRFPFDNVGVAVFCNDDSFGSVITDILKWRIVDGAFALDPVDWSTRSKLAASTAFNQSLSSTVPRPAEPTDPRVPLSSMTGVYNDPAYGSLELCLIPQSGDSNDTATPSCQTVLNELPEQLPGAIDTSVPTLVARWDKLWITHIKLEHFNKNLFNVTTLKSTPILNSGNETANGTEARWAQVWSTASAEFAVHHNKVTGFGMVGLWGAEAGVPSPSGKTVKQRAEVWFVKQG